MLSRFYANSAVENAAFLDPHPYGFLEDQGHDVEQIKAGNLKCKTLSYILDEEPNNLYIATYVETKATNPYYTEYLLKYALTDKEVSDYKLLHNKPYIQSIFLNDEISQIKTPEIVSETKCTVQAHTSLQNDVRSLNRVKNLIGTTCSSISLKSFDVQNGTFELYLYVQRLTFSSVAKIGILYLQNGTKIVGADNGVFTKPYKYGEFGINENLADNAVAKQATMFHNQSVSLLNATNFKDYN